jgi:YidC/Oxa1 family membrane protein insertase
MDRNSLIGLGLIGAILIGWMYFTAPSKEEIERNKRVRDSIALAEQKKAEEIVKTQTIQKQKDSLIVKATVDSVSVLPDSILKIKKEQELVSNFRDFAPAASGKDEEFVLENNLIKVFVSSKGGKIKSVELKNFSRPETKDALMLFNEDSLKQALVLNVYNNSIISTDSLYFNKDQSSTASTLNLILPTLKQNSFIKYQYFLNNDSYNLEFKVAFIGMQQIISTNNDEVIFDWNMKMPSQELHIEKEKQTSGIFYSSSGEEQEIDNLSLTGSDEKSITESGTKWVAFKQQFFTAAITANTQFNQGALLSTFVDNSDMKYVKTTKASLSFNYKRTQNDEFGMKFFFGPNQYYVLKNQQNGMEKLIPMGWWIFSYLNKWIVIPVFDLFKNSTMSMGWVILILTVIIKLLLLPIAYKTYLSSAKMRLLKPEMDVIREKHKGDPMKMNQDNMSLYKRAGVSPLSGCIPALLQLPILIALLNFFPASFELRQEPFLWATDLSTYDSVWDFGYVPIIHTIYGDHISLFALLMFVSTIIYTWMNQKMMPMQNNQMPGMQTMMYLMPVIFLSFMNSYSAGLSWYYFLANVITFLQTFIMRKLISDDKLRAQIDENMKKPVKKSGFQQRLEEMQKRQIQNRK